MENEVSQEVIDAAKLKEPTRQLAVITLEDSEDDYKLEILVAAPLPTDFTKYIEMVSAADRDIPKIKLAQERLVLMCLRSPSKEEIKNVFQAKSMMVGEIVEQLQQMQGSNVRASKKKV